TRGHAARLQARVPADRVPLRPLQRAPGPRVSRRSSPDRTALLQQRGGAALTASALLPRGGRARVGGALAFAVLAFAPARGSQGQSGPASGAPPPGLAPANSAGSGFLWEEAAFEGGSRGEAG